MEETHRDGSSPCDGDPAAWVREFVPLNRRRQRGERLAPEDLARWERLRDLLEDCQGAVPPAPGERRRRSLRVRAHAKVIVTTPRAQELLVVHDLSENGLFLRTQRPSPPGATLHIELLDKRGGTLELEATVIWVRTEGEGHGPAGMGVDFHAVSAGDRSLLTELVEAALESI